MQVTDKAYTEHQVFAELDRYAKFYERLAMLVFPFVQMGTKAICNPDTYVYSSMQGTVESIKIILLAGRINDAYTLLRKYYDSAVINVYANLYLKDNFSIEKEKFVVEEINNWMLGKKKLPDYRVMSEYIRASKTLKPINDLLYRDDKYKLLRNRCNNHTHYNSYSHVMFNDNEIHIKDRGQVLERFRKDAQDIFFLHLGYVFFLNDHYMMSRDHLDALECNMQPEENSQYWVEPFIQDIFHEVITPGCPDITAAIKANSAMQLS